MKGIVIVVLAFWLIGCTSMLCNSPIGDNKTGHLKQQWNN